MNRCMQVAAALYSALIVLFVWQTRELSFARFHEDRLVAVYSLAVVVYVLARYVIALFYRSYPDVGHEPTVSIVIPAFNEEDAIADTIAAALQVEYPEALTEVLVVNDGSTDQTWQRMLEARSRSPRVRAIHLGRNYGKRAAMAEGIRRSTGEIIVFVDSDSYLDPAAVHQIVQPFADRRVGAVCGHAFVANAMKNWITKMQQVRYFSAFRVIKATESLMSGTVICASGCCAAYRRRAIEPLVEEWEFQRFLGRPATFGDDRALTNRVLRDWRVVYQSTARVSTNAPESLRVFLRQQLRWKKSWLRESLYVCRTFWRKNPIAVLFTYASIAFPLAAPFVVANAFLGAVTGQPGTLWFYLLGTYAMALVYSLYYGLHRGSGMWFHGMSFTVIHMILLVFQTYWALFTMNDTRWGTRASSVDHAVVDPLFVTDISAGWGSHLEAAPVGA